MDGPAAEMARWPATHAGAVVVARTGATTSYGDTDRVFRLASVTKLLVAYAVLVAVEETTMTLDDPIGPPGVSVRHLLAHAGGIGPDEPTPIAPPGRWRIYSNAGFELLGAHLEQRSGLGAAAYLHEAVLAPLGMTSTTLQGSPAHAASASAADLGRFGAELLQPTLLAGETLVTATSVQFPALAGVLPGYGRQDPNDWGLGFELRDDKSPHWTGMTNSRATYGHFGRAGTFLWVDPEVGVACAALTDEPFGPWAIDAWPRFSDAVLTAHGGSAA